MFDTKTRRREKIRLLLVDDHPIVRSGVRRELTSRRDIQVVGEAGNGKEALAAVEKLEPDIVLLDISLGKMSGIDVAKKLKKKSPGVKILVFTVHNEKEYILEFAKLGVSGYMSKEASRDELVKAFQSVHAGKTYFSDAVSQVLISQYLADSRSVQPARPSELTEREQEILILIAEGNSNKETAARLKISPRTVETHRERIMRKLDIHTAIGLAKFAIKRGMISVAAQT
ncbi:MAG: hypothetical protein A2X67_11630 [Ignavibacteria bacterium GWA2_55_11]|nr:MAG: hypothetical protein A2X67_11630 [Ignavibacteria bacterium GWA2_55_11]OGU68404.1 MAG: hypothetical protein A3C56_07685 [Ignavibacteria bacterium RIFCSPHIGHO2_02_FULL_56_12]OGU72479.1 MAG: hypothetical protein A3G43_09040 [Ignavibacteria bacterium RIFCSPLOWO2_12_FULL_56_21]